MLHIKTSWKGLHLQIALTFSVAGWRWRSGGLVPGVNKKSSNACLKQALHKAHVSFCFLTQDLFVIQPTPLGFSVNVLSLILFFLFFSVPDGCGWTEGCCFEGRGVHCVRICWWVCILLLPVGFTQPWKNLEIWVHFKIWFSKTVKVNSILNINVSNHAHLYSVIQWPTEMGNSVPSFPSSLSLAEHATMNSDWPIRKRIVPSCKDIGYLTAMDTLLLNCSMSHIKQRKSRHRNFLW